MRGSHAHVDPPPRRGDHPDVVPGHDLLADLEVVIRILELVAEVGDDDRYLLRRKVLLDEHSPHLAELLSVGFSHPHERLL